MIDEHKYDNDNNKSNDDTDIVKWIRKHVGDFRWDCIIE